MQGWEMGVKKSALCMVGNIIGEFLTAHHHTKAVIVPFMRRFHKTTIIITNGCFMKNEVEVLKWNLLKRTSLYKSHDFKGPHELWWKRIGALIQMRSILLPVKLSFYMRKKELTWDHHNKEPKPRDFQPQIPNNHFPFASPTKRDILLIKKRHIPIHRFIPTLKESCTT